MPRIIKQKIEFEGRIEEREVVIEGDDLPVWSASELRTAIWNRASLPLTTMRSQLREEEI